MKAYVITILDLPESCQVAQRCVASARKFGVEVLVFPAITPKDRPRDLASKRGFSLEGFENNAFSRFEPCLSAFLSHSSLWKACAEDDVPYLILEHDAVFVAPVPEIEDWGVCNLGRPSFGRFQTPVPGLGSLVSKDKLPGAHAYVASPQGARRLLEAAATSAEPTDVFINVHRFPWLSEYYPWPVIADDSFTTIQTDKGSEAKHNKVRIL